MPSIIDCKAIDNNFQETNLFFYMNYEDISHLVHSELDQLICLAKGDLNLMIIDPVYVDKVSQK